MAKQLFNNQRHIRPIKIPTDKYHAPYACFNVAAQQKARITLNGNAFKLYNYFCSYDQTYNEFISRKNIEEKTGLSRTTYSRAWKELEDHGYIQKDPNNKNKENYYIFVESGVKI